MSKDVDVCLILEGTYPYVTGGVSTWAHNLILSLPELKFSTLSLLPPNFKGEYKFKIPDNVVEMQEIEIQILPPGVTNLSTKKQKKLFDRIERPLLNMQHKGRLEDLRQLMSALDDIEEPLGDRVLLLSEDAWRQMVRMYSMSMGNACFLDYFWSWRGLIGGLYSVLLGPLPTAKCYHALCTGYAGLVLAKAYLENGRPCVITEHGIYTNERRIELASAEWIQEVMAVNLDVERARFERGLKDLWIDTFSSYSRICYQACQKIITLHTGNQPLQLLDGAEPERMSIIPNGINMEKFSNIPRESDHPPTVALIGRVVPIKDIKTYIRAIANLKKTIPDVVALVIGPEEEDPAYFSDCKELLRALKLENTLFFKGKQNVVEWLPKIDIIALTSISESQPLTLLEAGAAGIPAVATNVGSCQEILYGAPDELPPLGRGGLVAPLANPVEIANQMEKLLVDKEFYKSCSETIKRRVETYYTEELQTKHYRDLYESLISQ